MTEKVDPIKFTREFAIDKIKKSKDRMDYIITLQTLYFTEYCEAPTPVREMLDGLHEAGRVKATAIAIRDKVDEIYGLDKE